MAYNLHSRRRFILIRACVDYASDNFLRHCVSPSRAEGLWVDPILSRADGKRIFTLHGDHEAERIDIDRGLGHVFSGREPLAVSQRDRMPLGSGAWRRKQAVWKC